VGVNLLSKSIDVISRVLSKSVSIHPIAGRLVQMARFAGVLGTVLAMSTESTGKESRGSRGIGHIIFDLDGTLVDNMELIVRSVNFAVKDILGKQFSRKELHSRFGRTLEQILADLVPARDRENAVHSYHAYYREHFKELASVYEGIPALIGQLENAKIGMAIYTGSDGRMTKTTLELSGLQEFFPIVVTADDVSEAKPDPEGLIRVLELLRGTRERSMYLGDAVRDIEAAKRAAMRSAAALWGSGDPAVLRRCGPDFAFETPLDALRQLV
jgi:HAD superfamily hydrolase (TIGR01549 family)